jgi:hypothetical protein
MNSYNEQITTSGVTHCNLMLKERQIGRPTYVLTGRQFI